MEWGAQLEQKDWATIEREPFKRSFISLPDCESESVIDERQALHICIEDHGSLSGAPSPISTFEELDVLPSYVTASLKENGLVKPLPIQAQALPLVLAGCDVIGLAQTGSGKTLAFLLPAIVHIEAQETIWNAVTPIALVLAPTRELAVQISDEATKVTYGSRKHGGNHRGGVWAACIYGGGKRYEQERNLKGSQIAVATPGRLIDFISTGVVSLKRVTYLVLDEADRMLDMGFSGDMDQICGQVRPERQVLFFSATWSQQVQHLAGGFCHKGTRPVRISYGQNKSSGADQAQGPQAREGIIQEVVVVDITDDYDAQVAEKRKLLDEHLADVLEESQENKILVFVSQKTLADELADKLSNVGFKAAAMHGGKAQDSRLWTLDQFRKGELRLLIATDVIGRGIDIPHVSHVVIYEMGTVEDYIHRIGRTARGATGASGHALVFFEYYRKEPQIAQELADVLRAAKQPVPDGLTRIIEEVSAGKREVYSNSKWGSNKWSGDKWSTNTWNTNGKNKNSQDDRTGGYNTRRWNNGNWGNNDNAAKGNESWVYQAPNSTDDSPSK